MTRDEYRRYARRRRAAIAAGTWQQPVPAAIVRDRINTLRASGMSLAAIAHAANLSASTLAPIAYPEHRTARRYVTPHTARVILAVKVTDAPDWAWLPNVGTRRRIEALQWMGWPLSELAARMGVTTQAVSRMKRQERVSVARARKVADLFDALAMTPGPDRKTRAWARKDGAVGPLAWDDIDDPTEAPNLGADRDDEVDPAAVERTLAGDRVPLTRPERVEVIRRLAQRGLSDAEMGAVVGITGRSVQRIRTEFGIDTGWVAA